MSTSEKAMRINLDKAVHGTLAEIGAGQEVARWLFRVGGAASTVAKTISAYDMAVSDAIYGTADRYVSRRRLEAMLDHEYSLLLERLNEKRGSNTCFFVFADTVAARSYSRHEEGQGWLGVRFQSSPHSDPCDIIIHVRMFDTENTHEQEALGIVGMNLLHGAYYLRENPEALIRSLLDDLSRDRIEIDMIKFGGHCFTHLDARLMSLRLVQLGLTEAAMFTADGEAIQPGEVLHNKPVLILRGSFRPITNTVMDMLESAVEQFLPSAQESSGEPVILMEMTLHNLAGDSGIDPEDFLERAKILEGLGKTVLISNLAHYHSVAVYLSHYTNNRIGIVLGIPALEQVFDERYYSELDGGILEAFGRLFKARVEMLVYPSFDAVVGQQISVANMQVAPQLRHLYQHLVENRLLVPIRPLNQNQLGVFPRQVLALIQKGDPNWERNVPPQVAKLIKEGHYFGYTDPVTAG